VPRYRSHIALTVWPIAALFALELARMWPALGGASSFAAKSPVTWLSLVAHTVLVVVFVGAYARGWSGLSGDTSEGAGPYRSMGCQRLQQLAGWLAWAFVVAHLVLQWVMTVRVGPVALSHYELLRGFLSRPVFLGLYLFGLAALGLFLAQGAAASFRAWGFARRPESSRWLEVGCTLASAVMVLMAINVLSHFVTGRAYWMGQ
jgi:hypothetical protein